MDEGRSRGEIERDGERGEWKDLGKKGKSGGFPGHMYHDIVLCAEKHSTIREREREESC